MKNKAAIVLSLTIALTTAGFCLPQTAHGAQSTGTTSTIVSAHPLTGIKKLQTGNINAVILGDSIAVSQGASDPEATGWDSDLSDILAKLYPHKIIWDNKASSGTLVDYCLQRAEEIDSSADAVFICVGRNDRNFYTSTQFCLKYAQLVRLIKQKAPQADIFCIVEPPMVSSDESLFEGIRSAITIVCLNNNGVNLLDAWSAFPTDQTALADVLVDGLHPKDTGYRLMSNYICKQLVTKINSNN
ncbi:SGNH/GDSL hydrolase family protein [Desulfosporosinus sp. PR]|uniref:SGNH/GDSL hydrolase family protein n=1 Tax=Candidatus Desulfosporosinus nitrosoreducens TaxID=3401928 RepID=UPI0027E971DD|nr:SGNH/GDSL hydrolase family protein [Desulfosporosinus sp. PR]MDQ7096308.1 SGNH/GDSL hydrolase family protein [Desulfosporosinus sp. PR]